MTPQELQAKIDEGMTIQRIKKFIIPEMRAYKTQYLDPLTLNFKILVEWDDTSGLLAEEGHVNSALAYLKRIGELERYDMLLQWQAAFKDVILNYDFLLLSIDGLDEIVQEHPGDMFLDDSKITLNFAETIDMRIQSLLTTYRQIWFDNSRCVEILPGNLRQFNIHVLVYSGGYFNMELYDEYDYNGKKPAVDFGDIDTKLFPTLRKLSDNYFNPTADHWEFNYNFFTIERCEIEISSGTKFFETVSNEPDAPIVKNSIILKYKFADYTGAFNNIMGDMNFGRVLKVAAFVDRESKKVNFWKAFGQEMKKAFKAEAKGFVNAKKQQLINYSKMMLKPLAPIGKAIKDLQNPAFLAKMTRNMTDFAWDQTVDKKVMSAATSLNNLVLRNFPTDLLDRYKDNLIGNEFNKAGHNKPGVNLTPGTPLNSIQEPIITQSSDKHVIGIKYEKSENIYKRNGF